MEVLVEKVRLLFSVDRIIDVDVSENILWLGLQRSVVRIDLDDPARVIDYALPRGSGRLRKEWSALGGIFVTSTSSQSSGGPDDASWLGPKGRKLRTISGLASATAVCAAPTTGPKSGNIGGGMLLVGTANGTILEVTLETNANETYFKRDVRSVRTIWSGNSPIVDVEIFGDRTCFATGNELVFLSDDGSNTATRLPAIATQFITGGSHMAVRLENGRVLHGSDPDNLSEAPILGVSHVIITAYHLVCFVEAKIVLISSVDNEEVLCVPIETDGDVVKGICIDESQHTRWFWTHTSLYELKIANEEAVVWPRLLAKNKLDDAMVAAGSNKKARAAVLAQQGRSLISSEPDRAARLLGLSDEPFETAALLFVDKPHALAHFLSARLTHTSGSSQRTVLTSWLVELYLRNNDSAALEELFGSKDVDKTTVEAILSEHGSSDYLIKWWVATRQVGLAVAWYTAHGDWPAALDLLRRFETSDVEEAAYAHAAVLLCNAPQATVESWIRLPQLDVRRLVPALVEYSSKFSGPMAQSQAVRYLRHVLSSRLGDADAAQQAYNTLVLVSAMDPDSKEDELLNFLRERAGEFSDQDFALRACLQHGKIRSAVYLYAEMGLREDAVAVCLEHGLLDLGTELAAGLGSGEMPLRRHLLREIAQRMVAAGDAKSALKLVGLLRVDDLLALFPDFDTLDELAPEIVRSLEKAKTQLASINAEMDETLGAAREMRQELAAGSDRKALVEPGEPCQSCGFPLITRKFFVFPCQHGYHGDCLSRETMAKGSQRRRRQLAAASEHDAEVLLGEACLICSDDGINLIDVPLNAEF